MCTLENLYRASYAQRAASSGSKRQHFRRRIAVGSSDGLGRLGHGLGQGLGRWLGWLACLGHWTQAKLAQQAVHADPGMRFLKQSSHILSGSLHDLPLAARVKIDV
mmetsp:Transcript_44159/g.95997  ORF Transcript_44159/g.95997 Transcript_44159/m.95997 type:complete len:106 (-) Transcript_44159:666-983(-)